MRTKTKFSVGLNLHACYKMQQSTVSLMETLVECSASVFACLRCRPFNSKLPLLRLTQYI